MSRRRAAVKRKMLPDAKYGSVVLSKLINCLMYGGKKSVAETIVYSAVEKAAEKLGVTPIEGFDKILENVRPSVEVRSRRFGGATYQVPVDVRPERALALSLRWLIHAARSRKAEKTMSGRLAAEFLDAYNSRGAAVKKRDDTHRMADANRAFAHYRW